MKPVKTEGNFVVYEDVRLFQGCNRLVQHIQIILFVIGPSG
jgi:hypothetical protein